MTKTENGTDRNAYVLASMAECLTPDSHESPGAEFLTSTVEALAESVRWDAENDGGQDIGDMIHEIADGAVPIYTRKMWETFTDLGAYQEGTNELEDASADMDQRARVALYMIAERLCFAIVTEDADRDAI